MGIIAMRVRIDLRDTTTLIKRKKSNVNQRELEREREREREGFRREGKNNTYFTQYTRRLECRYELYIYFH